MIARVSAMVFLATPHKGSGYAQILNSILRTSPGVTAKAYVWQSWKRILALCKMLMSNSETSVEIWHLSLSMKP